MNINYTDEKNIQMLISILKQNGIRKIIASPGTTNMAFVASVQNDPFFEIYSCVDERSACYMACGLSNESGEPVVLTCTGATASRNYMPGLTEAFYRKIPILAVTSAPHFSKIANDMPQIIDRTAIPNDIVKLSVQIPIVNTPADEHGCNILLNKAILELKRRGGGPVHINISTSGEGTKSFNTKELPYTRTIDRIEKRSKFPELSNKRIGVFVGNHKRWQENLILCVEKFCEQYNAVVLCDHTSNYNGKYKILLNIICDQESYETDFNNFDVLIHIGDVSGAYVKINTKEVWRVNSDGEIKDTFSKLKYVFEMDEMEFFEKYIDNSSCEQKLSNYTAWRKEFDELEQKAIECELPFSNIWIARNIINKIPNNSSVHLAILNSLRSWNYFENKNILFYNCNTGGFGIDGPTSTMIGASLNNKNKNYFGIIGDLAFFYDLNSLGNKNIGKNLRIILINNGCGTEFHNYSHPASRLGDMTGMYIAADGHFGNKSPMLVKNYVENLGFEYICAKTKEDFLKHIEYFTSSEIYAKPIVFEIFTNSEDESLALKKIRNLKTSIKGTLKGKARNILSESTKNKIKKILGK